MKLLTKAPRGTQDILPKDSYKWQFIENLVLEAAGMFGFREIRVPTFDPGAQVVFRDGEPVVRPAHRL